MIDAGLLFFTHQASHLQGRGQAQHHESGAKPSSGKWETEVHNHVMQLQIIEDPKGSPRVISQGGKRNRMLSQAVDTMYARNCRQLSKAGPL